MVDRSRAPQARAVNGDHGPAPALTRFAQFRWFVFQIAVAGVTFFWLDRSLPGFIEKQGSAAIGFISIVVAFAATIVVAFLLDLPIRIGGHIGSYRSKREAFHAAVSRLRRILFLTSNAFAILFVILSFVVWAAVMHNSNQNIIAASTEALPILLISGALWVVGLCCRESRVRGDNGQGKSLSSGRLDRHSGDSSQPVGTGRIGQDTGKLP